MFGVTIKNMLKDKMVTFSLIIGFLLSTAVVSSIPMYSRGILNNMLKNTFDEAISKSKDKSSYPASFTETYVLNSETSKSYELFVKQDKENMRYINRVISDTGAPIITKRTTYIMNNINFSYINAQNDSKIVYNDIVAVSDLLKHVKIIQGTAPSENVGKDKIVDVIVDEDTFNNYCMKIGQIYDTNNVHDYSCIKLKIAGVFKIDTKDPFWTNKDTPFYSKLFVTKNEFFNILKSDYFYIHSIERVPYTIIFDYKNFQYDEADKIYSEIKSNIKLMNTIKTMTVDCAMPSCLETYIEGKTRYITLIWIFAIPILIIMLIFIYMTAGFAVDSDKEQIALLKSRGASISEILRIYLYEGLIICGIGLLIGPVTGFYICRLLGHVIGFLDFDISSKYINFKFDRQVYGYSAAAALVMMATLMLSVYHASKNTVVELKHAKSTHLRTVFKSRNLDFVFLAVSMYGYYIYSKYDVTSMFSKGGVPVDPLLYILSTVFIIGFGMFMLRIYKYFIKFLCFINKKTKSSSYYLGLINVLRYHLDKVLIMLFVVITVSMAVFDIKISKNINTSSENTIRYLSGADMTISQDWSSKIDDTQPAVYAQEYKPLIYYIEPDYPDFSKVRGITAYTKVLNVSNNRGNLSIGGKPSTSCSIMGIIPHEFGKIAWFDSSLLKYHWYYYLNALTTHENYVLISRQLSNTTGIRKGDTIYYDIDGGLYISSVVLDVIDYWPGCGDMKGSSQIIGNFNYIFTNISKVPYEIWLKKDGRTSNKEIYDAINKMKLNIKNYSDSSVEIYNSRNDTFFKGTNSILSLGFIAILIVTVIGFVLYWIKSLKSRKMVFGVYRALGINLKNIIWIIAFEQIFTLGASIILGIINGNITCRIFLPLILSMWQNGKFTIPIKNISYISDYLSFGGSAFIVFIILIIILIKYIAKLKINEAIKMGEE